MRSLFTPMLAAARALCRYGTITAFAVLIGVVTWQVLGRVPGVRSPAWTEEVARFALLYLVAFSCGLALLRGELVNVDLFTAPLPAGTRRIVDRVVDIVVLGFALAILPAAWTYVANSTGETARAIEVPMIWIYLVVAIIPISLAFFSLARLLGHGGAPPPSHGEL
jgi:TRAP-type C4-dicarboxylate transport system permease small subunit